MVSVATAIVQHTTYAANVIVRRI